MKRWFSALQIDVIKEWMNEIRRFWRRKDDDDIFGSPYAIL